MKTLLLWLIGQVLISSCVLTPIKDSSEHRYLEGLSLEIDGRVRGYIVHTPDNYSSKKKYPMVFVFHGARGTPGGVRSISGFDSLSNKEGFITVYPYGTTDSIEKGYFWNAWECCGYALQQEVRDVEFIKKLIQVMKQDYSIDPDRIYATGFSNGGMFSLRLACEASEEFAAIASVGGSMFHDRCVPNSPPPVLLIQGKKDRVVPYEGGVGVNSSTSSAKLPSEDVFRFWTHMHKCKKEKSTEDKNTIHFESLECETGKRISLVAVKEEEHTWPVSNFPASEEIWKFLKQWSRPKNKIPS